MVKVDKYESFALLYEALVAIVIFTCAIGKEIIQTPQVCPIGVSNDGVLVRFFVRTFFIRF